MEKLDTLINDIQAERGSVYGKSSKNDSQRFIKGDRPNAKINEKT